MDTQSKASEQSDTPQGMERRMVLRLLAHWRDWCGSDRFPSFENVEPAAIEEMWGYCFVLDFLGFTDDPVIRMVGDDLLAYLPGPIAHIRLSEAPPKSLIEHAAGYYGEVLSREVPISRGGQFKKYDGKKVLFRSIILPMSDDGYTISGLLGAANCREVASG